MNTGAVFVARQAIDALLSSDAPCSTLAGRACALEKQAQLCERFYPWPRLAASFRADAARVREKFDAQRKGSV